MGAIAFIQSPQLLRSLCEVNGGRNEGWAWVFEDAGLVTAVQENGCSNVEDVASAPGGCQVSFRSTSWSKKAGWQVGRLVFLGASNLSAPAH